MNHQEMEYTYKSLTEKDILVSKVLIWGVFGLLYLTLLVFSITVLSLALMGLVTLVFIVLGLVLYQQLVRLELRKMTRVAHVSFDPEPSSYEVAEPLQDEDEYNPFYSVDEPYASIPAYSDISSQELS